MGRLLTVLHDGFLTTGEFSRRVGVSVELLRAWERRYGVPAPARAPNGRRMYTRADERAVAAMRRALARGMPAAAAARFARLAPDDGPDPPPSADGPLRDLATRLRAALDHFDESDAQEALDQLFGAYTADTALGAVVLPLLREVGERWSRAEIGVGDEHFATNLIAGRLQSLSRKWDGGDGPRALLACPSGELHTIGLLAFGLALRSRGWRITFLGADTPTSAIAQVAAVVKPAWIVVASISAEVFHRRASELAELAATGRVAIAGAGASPTLASSCRATLLAQDPLTEAAAIG